MAAVQLRQKTLAFQKYHGILSNTSHFIIAHLSPLCFGTTWTPYHIEIIIAFLALVASIPSMLGSHLLRLPQTIALACLSVTVFISLASDGWLGGAVAPFYGFLLLPYTFFVVAATCNSKRHLQIVTLVMLLGSAYFIICAALDLHSHVVRSLYLFGDGTLRESPRPGICK